MIHCNQGRRNLLGAVLLLMAAPALYALPSGPSTPTKPPPKLAVTRNPLGATTQAGGSVPKPDPSDKHVAQAVAALTYARAHAAGQNDTYKGQIGQALGVLETLDIPESQADAPPATYANGRDALRQADTGLSAVSESSTPIDKALRHILQAESVYDPALGSGTDTSHQDAFDPFPYLQAALLGVAVVLLVVVFFRLRTPTALPDGSALASALAALEQDAEAAAQKYSMLARNYDEQENQCTACEREKEALSEAFMVQASNLMKANARIAALTGRNPSEDQAFPDDGRSLQGRVPSFDDDRYDYRRQSAQRETMRDDVWPSTGPLDRSSYRSDVPSSSPSNLAAAQTQPFASPAPVPPPPPPSFGEDPQRDYLQAVREPALQAEFRRIHLPFGVSCRNLGQRSIEGVALIFERDPVSRSLVAVSLPAEVLIFPGFSIDPGSTRSTLEGIYTYPGEFSELAVATAARAEQRGDLYYLTRPGTFHNA